MAPRPAGCGGLRQQIVAVLREHPEGLSPKAVQTLLQRDKDVRSIMKGLAHRGLLTRLAAGRYVVAGQAAP
jgi:predicted transcriptional regulator of viral defense system